MSKASGKQVIVCPSCGFESVFAHLGNDGEEIERLRTLLAAAEQGQRIDNINSNGFYRKWKGAEARVKHLERELETERISTK